MKVCILTEGNKDNGFGHVARCKALYQGFEEKGIDPKMLINGDKSVASLLKGINFDITDWINNADNLFDVIKGTDVAIVDSYLADQGFYEKVSSLTKTAVYFDDNKRLEYPGGIIINGNMHAEELGYRSDKAHTLLLGKDFTPLRKVFWDVSDRVIKDEIAEIMITAGCKDDANFILKILKMITDEYPKIKKNVLIIKNCRHMDELGAACDGNTELISGCGEGEMKKLLTNSDIVISGGGQTLYEAARVGTPAIGICFAENQLANVEGCAEKGFVEYIGWFNTGDVIDRLRNAIEKLWARNIRMDMSDKGRGYIDGGGIRRLVDNIMGQL